MRGGGVREVEESGSTAWAEGVPLRLGPRTLPIPADMATWAGVDSEGGFEPFVRRRRS